MNNFTNIRRLLINEISLEGLDGITLQALWLRIADETKKKKLPYPEPLQAQYWNTICQIQDFSFYELNEPRPNLVLYDRFKYIDCDIEEKEEDIPDDIYVHKPIDDVLNGIRGSCLSYFTRKNITSEVRLSLYQEVKERQTPSLATLVKLYVCRTYHVWKEADILPWLEKNIHRVLDRVDAGDECIKDCETKRSKRYQGSGIFSGIFYYRILKKLHHL